LTAQWRDQPGRLVATLIAIALGVALGTAVYLVNTAALDEFGLAAKRLVGEADLIVRGPREAFPESVFVDLARDPSVSMASPMIELEAAIPGNRDPLKILGVDPFRASSLQPALMGDIANNLPKLFRPDGLFLSHTASAQLHLRRGDSLEVIVGSAPKKLRVLGVLAADTYSQSLGIMDIASAQWSLGAIGQLNRVDLRLRSGVDAESFRRTLSSRLPAGVFAVVPQIERDRAVTVTRAYRVNLNMLALVALWTGAFLVFSTQSLAVLRRRRTLGLLRALGVTRLQLQSALVGEGIAMGALGSLVGIVLGLWVATVLIYRLSGDLGNGQLHIGGGSVHFDAINLVAFFLLGTLVTGLGAWLPARAAARQAPARALKGGDHDYNSLARNSSYVGLCLLLLGTVVARLPTVYGLPLFGYVAVALLLLGAILLVPTLTVMILRRIPRTHRIVFDTAVAQLRENVGLSTLSLAAVIVSFSLMVAMAIMVYSFRQSFDHWLGKFLPAEMQMREPLGNDTAYWSPTDQAQLASVKGIARIQFRRTRPLTLDASRPPVTLIARDLSTANVAEVLPLVELAPSSPRPSHPPVWISESLQDLYGFTLGETLTLALGGQRRPFTVIGIWRDYARPLGSIVMESQAYRVASNDLSANEASVWLDPGYQPTDVEAALRARIAPANSLEIMTSSAVREKSLRLFDRAFLITYALEAIAVLIGLASLSFTASSTALARRAEFGMLRHVGVLKRQIVALLAAEGMLLSLFGVIYGLLLGAALSLVLVYVINRQSFHWSIDLAIPYRQLAAASAALIAAAALTALGSGRIATAPDAVRAVREDW
jgi:putative ABC transport system permease protein